MNTENEIKTFGYKLATSGERFFASLVEGILFITLIMGVSIVIGKPFYEYLTRDFQLIEVVYSAVSGLIIGAIFYPLFVGNLGHKIFNLKVVSEETGEDYNKAQKGAMRECLKYVLSYLIIPIIWILWDSKNQNLYDKITKTLVVKKYSKS